MPYRAAILAAIESLRDLETGSEASSIRKHIQEQDSLFKWNENLFQETLKSLIRQEEILQVNGTNYKFTDAYLKKRAEALRARADLIQEHLIKIHSAAAPSVPQSHGVYDGETCLVSEWDTPKKKTVHAKVKINDAKIITVVNPDKPKRDTDMEVEEESAMVTEVKKRKHHIKIIPKKVSIKKM